MPIIRTCVHIDWSFKIDQFNVVIEVFYNIPRVD